MKGAFSYRLSIIHTSGLYNAKIAGNRLLVLVLHVVWSGSSNAVVPTCPCHVLVRLLLATKKIQGGVGRQRAWDCSQGLSQFTQ